MTRLGMDPATADIPDRMGVRVEVRGTGWVEVAALGPTDAEHLVEKELGRLWPEARVTVLEISRTDSRPLLVQEYRVAYRLDAAIDVDGPALAEARTAAPAVARSRLISSRYTRTEWRVLQPRPG
jgi:hypothetical protein